ncbi:hypothetical protein SAMN05518849_11661 [Sphingobium sp. AP50]|nr:hypothetical protein SAMN05518849_11661 [Sphingobium sp. AP50]
MIDRLKSFLARWAANFGRINVDKAIDRSFRFLEMIILSTLVGFALKVVEPTIGLFVTVLMSVFAGIYLGLPIARWHVECLQRPLSPSHRKRYAATASITLGLTAVQLVIPLQTLLSATMQIDTKKARKAYSETMDRIEETGCARAHMSIEECEKRLGRKITSGKAPPPQPDALSVQPAPYRRPGSSG